MSGVAARNSITPRSASCRGVCRRRGHLEVVAARPEPVGPTSRLPSHGRRRPSSPRIRGPRLMSRRHLAPASRRHEGNRDSIQTWRDRIPSCHEHRVVDQQADEDDRHEKQADGDTNLQRDQIAAAPPARRRAGAALVHDTAQAVTRQVQRGKDARDEDRRSTATAVSASTPASRLQSTVTPRRKAPGRRRATSATPTRPCAPVHQPPRRRPRWRPARRAVRESAASAARRARGERRTPGADRAA